MFLTDFYNKDDSLDITEVQPLLDFIKSSGLLAEFNNRELKTMENFLANKLRKEGILKVTKNTGMFIARQPIASLAK